MQFKTELSAFLQIKLKPENVQLDWSDPMPAISSKHLVHVP